MALPNTEKLTSQLSMMPDPALKRMAMMYKNDPYIFPLVIAEDGRRKQVRTAGAAAQAQPQPKVADQEIAQMAGMPENVGIGQLPAPNLARMAGGGIVAFEEGGEVERFQAGGMSRELAELVLQTAAKYNIDPNIAMRLVKQESGFDPNAVSKRGAVGLTQLMPDASEEMGLPKDERTDPAKNVNAGFAYLRKQLDKYGNDYSKALAAFNWGGGNVDKHLAKNEGAINPVGLPKETANYLTKILPGGSAMAAEPSKPAAAKPEPKPEPPKGQQPWYDRYRELMTSGAAQKEMLRGVQDVPAALVGAPVDVFSAALRPFGYKNQEPVMGSRWIEKKLESLGMREPDSANPDLQKIRAATTGIVSLYNPLGKAEAVETGIQAAARRQAEAAKAAEDAVARPRLAGPTTDTTMIQKPGYEPVINGRAKALEVADKERAVLAAAEAEKLAKLAAAEKPAQFATGVNRVGAMGTASNTAGVPAVLFGGADTGGGVPSVAPENYDPIGAAYQQQGEKKGSVDQELVKALSESKAKESGGLAGLFNDPMFLLGARLMAGKSQYALQNLGEAGIGTASDLMAQRKADVEGKYYGALAKRAEALAKTEGLTGPTQLAYFFGKGDTPEERVRTGYPLIQAMNNQMKALELDADVQKLYWTYAAEAVKSGQPPMQPKEWAQYNRTITAFNRPTFESRIGSGDERLPR